MPVQRYSIHRKNVFRGRIGKFLKGYGEIDEKEFLLHKVHTLLWVRIESEDEIRKAYEQELLKTIKTNY